MARPKGSLSSYTLSEGALCVRRGACLSRRRVKVRVNSEGVREVVPFSDVGRLAVAESLCLRGVDGSIDPTELSIYRRALSSALESPLVEVARKRAELEVLIHRQKLKDGGEGVRISAEVLKATELVLKCAKLQVDVERRLEEKKLRGRSGGRILYADGEVVDADVVFSEEVIHNRPVLRKYDNKKKEEGVGEVVVKEESEIKEISDKKGIDGEVVGDESQTQSQQQQ